MIHDLPGRKVEPPVDRIVPVHVLYEFDGPRIFTTESRTGNLLITYLCDESEDQRIFLLAPTSETSILLLETGHLTVRDALAQPWMWVVACDRHWSILDCRSVSFDRLPQSMLPEAGIPLLPSHTPLLTIRQVGSSLGPGTIPASVIRRAVEGASGAIKSLLEGAGLLGAIGRPDERYRKLYDLPVQRLAFGSFEVSFTFPSRGTLDVFEAEKRTVDQIAGLLRSGLQWLTSRQEAIDPTPQNRAIMAALNKLSPPLHGEVTEVHISGLLLGTNQPRVVLTKESTRRVRHALAQIPSNLEPVVATGYVREFDKDRGTFTLRDEHGDDVERFEVNEDLFDDALDAFDENFEVAVMGYRSASQKFARALTITRTQAPAL